MKNASSPRFATATVEPSPLVQQPSITDALDQQDKLIAMLQERLGDLQGKVQIALRPYPATPPSGSEKSPERQVSPITAPNIGEQ